MTVKFFYEVKRRSSWLVPGWVTLQGWSLLNLNVNLIVRLYLALRAGWLKQDTSLALYSLLPLQLTSRNGQKMRERNITGRKYIDH